MKRLILCADHRSPYTKEETPYKFCIAQSQVYAARHGCDFKFIEVKQKPINREWPWSKVLVLGKFIKEYDEIFWLDANATVLNHKVDIFEVLKSAKATAWERDPAHFPILYVMGDKDPKKVNSAIFLMDCRNKSVSVNFLNDWWNDLDKPAYETKAPYQDYVLNSLWSTDRTKRNYIKGVELPKDVFVHLPEAVYGAQLQLHEAKKYAMRLQFRKTKKIGIFTRYTNYYSNGCSQNVIFIKQSYEALGYTVDLLVEKYERNQTIIQQGFPIPLVLFESDKVHEYGFILFGSAVPSQQIVDLIKAAGVPRAMFHPMNSLDAMHIPAYCYDSKAEGVPLFEANFHKIADEVWVTENHTGFAEPYLTLLNNHKVKVRFVPLSWSPLFLEYNRNIPVYTPRSTKSIDIVIIEPNSSYVKNAVQPLLIAERFNQLNKDRLRKVFLFSSPSNRGAVSFFNSLTIQKEHKLRQLNRLPINEILNFFSNPDNSNGAQVVFLSHQVNLPMNYAYYDILHAQYPFLHNSPTLKDAKLGYHYEDVGSAVSQLNHVCEHSHKAQAQDLSYIESKHPWNPEIAKAFEELLPPSATVSLAPSVSPSPNPSPLRAQVAPVAAPVPAPKPVPPPITVYVNDATKQIRDLKDSRRSVTYRIYSAQSAEEWQGKLSLPTGIVTTLTSLWQFCKASKTNPTDESLVFVHGNNMPTESDIDSKINSSDWLFMSKADVSLLGSWVLTNTIQDSLSALFVFYMQKVRAPPSPFNVNTFLQSLSSP
jgi:hypothetical protein